MESRSRTQPDSPAFTATGRFVPLALLGRGAMGVVYRVRDLETDVEVALKTLSMRDPESLLFLKREFRLLSDIVHHNLVDLYELVVGEQGAFFTMEVIEGLPFTECVGAGAPRGTRSLDIEAFEAAAAQLVGGLAAVHARGKLHCDVKPSNVLIDRTDRVVLLDFGLAMAFGLEIPSLASDGVAGTLAYMAPEVLWGAAPSPAADWYGVGVLLYEALTGRLPFDGRAAAMLAAKERGDMPPLAELAPAVPRRLIAVVESLLAPRPERRPGGADILSALGGWRRPALPASATDNVFVGRASELRSMHDAYVETRAGACVVVQVRGPSGIGKTELLRKFVDGIAREGDVVVLTGRCNPHESVPFRALDRVVDALSVYLSSIPVADAEHLAPARAGALLRLFPVLECVPAFAVHAGEDDDVGPLELRRRAFGALRELLEGVAARRSLVIWIDDAHWADPDSIALVHEILAGGGPQPLLLVISFRRDGERELPAVARSLGEEGGLPPRSLRTLDLRRLSDEDTIDLARRLAPKGGAATPWLGDVVAEADGSPFVVQEITRSLRDTPQPASTRLADLLAERFRQLSPPARRLLEVACVAGQPLERGALLGAAGLGERGRSLVTGLEKRSLVRTAPIGDRLTIDVYHDRLREALLAAMPSELIRSRHGAIADALERQPDPDPASLLHHLREGGRPSEAASWAARAGDRAASAMTFADAARFYEEATSLRMWDPPTRRSLALRRADALVNAGQCAAAAPLYLTAAAEGPAVESHDLRRRAAGQLLISGRIDEGVEELRSLLADLGLRYPRTPRRARVAALGRAADLVRRWRDLDGNTSRDPDPLELTRVDTCHFAAKGLLAVDPARGVYFSILAVVLSIAAGERRRIGRDLATLGAMLAVAPGPLARIGVAMIDRADAISRERDDPHLTGSVLLAIATSKLVRGRWNEMLALCDESARLFRNRCHGVTPELNLSRMIAIRALEELGRVHEVRERTAELEREGAALGDLYAQATARLNGAFWTLAAGDSIGARTESRRTIEQWAQRTSSMQHFYALRIEACADIYEGAPEDALRRLDAAWPGIRRSQILLDPIVRVDAHGLRARSSLAVAERSGLRGLLTRVRRDRRVLERSGRADGVGDALLIRAGEEWLGGACSSARRYLEDARAVYEDAGMQLDALYVRRRLAQLFAHGAAPVRSVDDELHALGIGDPDAWLAIHAPGFTAVRPPDRPSGQRGRRSWNWGATAR